MLEFLDDAIFKISHSADLKQKKSNHWTQHKFVMGKMCKHYTHLFKKERFVLDEN